jgi:hypothetical protein
MENKNVSNHQPAIRIRENDFRRMIIPNIWKNGKIKNV